MTFALSHNMENHTIILLCNEKQYETKRIIKEGRKKGYEIKTIKTKNFKEKILEKSFVLLIRSVTGHMKEAKEIAKNAKTRKIRVIDKKFLTGNFYNKLTASNKLSEKNFFQPKTLELNKKNLSEIKKFSSEYVVVKAFIGKRGKKVNKIKKCELKKFLAQNTNGRFLAQEFFEAEKEVRVIVIGNKVIGAVEKKASSWKKNLSANAKANKTKISEKIKKACIKAAKIFEVEIAGIDVAISKEKIFVIEVNRSPGFKHFEKATGINIAGKIVDYIIKKQ